MSKPPDPVLLYHITHVDNLERIVQAGGLWSDAQMRQQQATHKVIGYDHIKERRLGLPVSCHAGTMVGEYVPFYLCPRSPMLFAIHNPRAEFAYRGGQKPIVHLVAKIADVINWATQHKVPWAFSTCNARCEVADFYNHVVDLNRINWDAVKARDWRFCRQEKQAEFLVHQRFPLALLHGAATMNDDTKEQVEQIFSRLDCPPTVKVKRKWYY